MSAPFSSGGAIILREPQTVTTGNGTFYVSNMVAGIYTCRVSTPITPTTFTLPVPDTNGVVNAYQLVTNGLPSILLTNLFLGNTLWVDRANGNDSSAARNDLVHRFQSMGAAKSNAIAGDTVVVLPGTYVGNNYAKSNVNWVFEPGVILTNRVTSNGISSAYGFFDDRAPGAAGPMTISGNSEMWFCDNNDSVLPNTNSLGALAFTNTASFPTIVCSRIFVGSRASSVNGINVLNDGRGVFRVTDGIYSTGELFSNYDDPDPEIVTYAPDASSGIYWRAGDLSTEVNKIRVCFYALWADERAIGATNDWYHKGFELTSTNATAVYFTSITNANSGFRLWLDPVTQITGFFPVGLYGSGKVYIRTEKISGVTSQAAPTIDLYGPPYLWLDSEKIVANSAAWFRVQPDNTSAVSTNEVHMTVQHYEAGSVTAGGFTIGGGTRGKVFFHGGVAEGGSNAPVLLTHAGGGETHLKGLTLDASVSRGTNSVMILSSNGVVLQGASLIAPPAATTTVSTNNSGIPILEVRGVAFLNKPVGSTIIQSNGLLQASTGLTMANALNLTAGLSVTGSFITNGTLIWYQTNNTPTLALPNGSLATITDGRFYVRTNGAWVQK